jgi:pilus assembly protein Flp/PilA
VFDWSVCQINIFLVVFLVKNYQLETSMKSMLTSLIQEFRALVRDEEGLTIVEYAVAGAVVAGVFAAAFSSLGEKITASFTTLTGKL